MRVAVTLETDLHLTIQCNFHFHCIQFSIGPVYNLIKSPPASSKTRLKVSSNEMSEMKLNDQPQI